MKHLDHIKVSDFDSLTDDEKKWLFKYVQEKYKTHISLHRYPERAYLYFVGSEGYAALQPTTHTHGHPLLSLEELRDCVAMGMLL